MAKSSTRRVTIYINGKEEEASSNRHLRCAYPQPEWQKLHLEAGEGDDEVAPITKRRFS